MCARPGKPLRPDNEYKRCGTANVFGVVEPKAGRHFTTATPNRSAAQFAAVLSNLAEQYPAARTIHLVMDNLNIHCRKSLTDAFGAEYRLNCASGICTSTEGIYVTYETDTSRLYFNDGSFWLMGALSSGNEEDAGARYPTLFQDSNGNQVTLTYATGRGLSWPNSSARLASITDPRTSGATYTFPTPPTTPAR